MFYLNLLQDKQLFKEWERKIPRADRALSSNCRICELHFPTTDVLKFYEHRLAGGEVVKVPRGKAALKDTAVPCKFPNLPTD